MLEFGNGHRLIESLSELPVEALRRCKTIYLDFETTSFDDKLDALNPWHHCWVAGFAITGDDLPGAWYVAINHRGGKHCVDKEQAAEVLDSIMTPEKTWVNHNIKYDMHVMANDLGVLFEGRVICTVVQAKILDTDRLSRGGYGLDVLSRDLLGEDIGKFEEEIRRWLFLRTRGKRQEYAKDYGRIPAFAMAPYACQDTITNRRLHQYQVQLMPAQCRLVSDIEIELTRALFDMERFGVRVDPTALRIKEIEYILRMGELDEELTKITGRSFNPVSSDQLFDVLCNQYGLPVLGWTEEDSDGEAAGNPSFDKEAMAKYLAHPLSPAGLIERIIEYKTCSTFRSLFLEQYTELSEGYDRLHSTYNQMVSTGRLSGSKPNPQQLNPPAKELILPDLGCAFLAADQSQIEFRIIAHFIRDQKTIEAYRKNPDTDFHQWVGDLASMKRRPAKTMNFMMGYGGGKKRAVRTMSMDKDIVGAIMHEVDSLIEAGAIPSTERILMFEAKAKDRATGVYNKYHNALPTLKPTAKLAADTCRHRGYVYDPLGRRRHLPPEYSFKAFNTLCQGYAAGIQKLTTIIAARAIKGTPLKMSANVHDETVFHGPIEIMEDRRTQVAIAWLLENPPLPEGALDVPLRAVVGTSRKHWREASKGIPGPKDKDGKVQYWITPEPAPLKYTEAEIKWLSSTPQEDLLEFLR
jgi:DNA polymerase I-like protein with 3'-5' exonuclease and polymerase domains